LFPPAILVIDDDLGTREMAERVLTDAGFEVQNTPSGREGAGLAHTHPFELILLDLRLPDIPGTEVIRELRSDRILTPFVLVSAFLTTPITVEAMKLGAVNVLEKPISIDDLLAVVVAALDSSLQLPRADAASFVRHDARAVSRPVQPRSAAERWARYVMKGCESEGDLKTLESWAKFIGVSGSSLCEACRLVGVQPHDARDFTRVLRALMHASMHDCRPDVLLDVSDRRTLRHLADRAGLGAPSSLTSLSVEQFLNIQQLIPKDHESLRVLTSLLLG